MNDEPIGFEVMASGLQFPEGPIAMADGSVLLVEIRRGTLSRVAMDGEIQVVAELGGGPNGAALGPDGAVYVCNNGGFHWVDSKEGFRPAGMAHDYKTGAIQRVDLATGQTTLLYDRCEGRALRGPNDIVFDSSGGFWFTDFGKSNMEMHQHGALYYALADGSGIRRVVEPLLSPNGVGLSPAQDKLYVSDTLSSRVFVFDLASPGIIAGQMAGTGSFLAAPPFAKVLGPLPGYQMLDSLAVEAGGQICVGTLINGAITVFDPEGGVAQHPVNDPVTSNICFGVLLSLARVPEPCSRRGGRGQDCNWLFPLSVRCKQLLAKYVVSGFEQDFAQTPHPVFIEAGQQQIGR